MVFRKYGFIGLIMILFAQINFILKVEPFASFYFPIIWFGFILVIDAIVYKLRKNSLIHNRPKSFVGMLVLSAAIWWIFELINFFVRNWAYGGGINDGLIPVDIFHFIRRSIYFATVVPAVFEIFDLIKSVHLFDDIKLKEKHKISKRFLFAMIGFGIFCLIAPILSPNIFYPLIWMSFFFLLDPINYLHHQPSIISHLKDRKLKIPLSLMFAGLICGFLWEFWNYWAAVKWTYTIPYLGFMKIFEMPILGYLGYPFFALELYAMYYFVKSLYSNITHHHLLR